jgi:DNA-binding CsgD family transcriptional regulator/tetratricopeptide (TPR) repeat protein
MVGRDRELARVTGLLNDALAGRGRLVLCTGEAGIGKTRLAEELAAVASARGVPVAWARATDRDSLPPYGLWRLVLAEAAVGSGSAADPWPAVFGAADLGSESSVAQRFALFAEVRRRLAQAAEGSGLLLVLDDLQWADEASAVLLAEVVRQLRGTRILVFATYRDSPQGVLPRLSAEANTERVDLHGLPADAVGDLLLAAGLEASPEQAHRVYGETGGNPFLVRELGLELARTLTEPTLTGLSVPGRVLEATAYRLTQLSAEARAVLQAAAVAGNSFSAGVVARMLDVPVLSLLGPLSEGAAAGFLVTGHQRFSHALVSSAVVARLSAEEQRRLHTAAADAIEALYEGQVRLHLADIARHRVEAARPGDRADRARAVAACEAAARVAWDALAFEEAVRLYRQALSVGEGELGEADWSRLELALAAALHRGGDLPGAQETATRAGRRAERRRDRLVLARTTLVMEATGVPEWDGEICRFCEQALSDSGAGDDLPDELRARVSARYAQALVYRGEYDRAGPVSRDALAAAEAAGDPATLVETLRARQLACCAPEGLAERIVLAGRMLAAAETLGSAWAEMWARLWRIDTLFETGQLRLVQRELTDLGSCLDRFASPVGQWHYLHVGATLALATGRFAEAARLAREAFKVFSDMGHPGAIGGLCVILSQSGLHTGLDRSGLAEAFDLVPAQLRPEAVDTTQGVATIFPALTLAMIRLSQGDRAGAEAAYALAGPIRSWTPSPGLRLSAWGHALAVTIGLDRTEDIEFLASRFEPFRGQHAANGAGAGVYMGPVELQLGLAAAALGHLDAAASDLAAAVSICDANGACGYAVQARVELAAVLTRRGDLTRARAMQDAAAGEASRLGMEPFTERIAALRIPELRIPELRARRPVSAGGDSPLSPRELEVARLVARGLTNKQIGEALFVAERTAENHVQHILVKLGFSNRSQIAAWATVGRE